jgi:hypothetical protein
MTDKIAFREINPGDIDSMVAMLDSMYDLKRSKEFLVWQCFKNFNVRSLMGAFDGDRIVGMFGVQKRTLTNGVICGQGSWLNISPAYKGRGYFARLGELAIKHLPDIDVVCVFANRRAKVPLEKSLKFETIGAIDLLVNDDLLGFDTKESECEPVGPETRFDCANRVGAGSVGFVYTPAYRIWRYTFNPMYSYWIVKLETGEFSVIKKFHDPDSGLIWGDIVDLEYDPENEAGLLKLVRETLSHLRRLGAVRATIWALPEMCLRRIALEFGFRASNYKTFFSFKVLNRSHEYLRDFSMWSIRQADATNY